MKRFLIERNIPGASELTEEQLAAIACTSNAAVDSLGVPYRWVTSYVAGDKIYCVHEADDEDQRPPSADAIPLDQKRAHDVPFVRSPPARRPRMVRRHI